MSSSTEPKRMFQLDVLRAVAVLLVIGAHFPHFPETIPQPIAFIGTMFRRNGWVGVPLFFVLSGFLISGLLFREYVKYRRINYPRFFVRRGLKIYPAFYVLIAATVAMSFWNGTGVEGKALLSEIAFIQNYGWPMWPHTWSLAVEEHFYLMLPILMIFLARRGDYGENPFTRLPTIFIAVAVVCMVLRLVTQHFSPNDGLVATHLQIDSLLFGVLISYHYHFHPDAFVATFKSRRWILFLVAVVILAPTVFRQQITWTYWRTVLTALLYLGFGSLLIMALMCGAPRMAGLSHLVRFLAFVGTHSYSIYLWHMPVRIWIMGNFKTWHQPLLLQVAVYIVLSVGIGIAMAKLVEFPVLKVRDRFFPSRSQPMKEQQINIGKAQTEPGVVPQAD